MIAAPRRTNTFYRPSGGFSEAAVLVEKRRQERRESRLQKTQDELFDLSEECKNSDWDGAGAIPVSLETYKAAYFFLASLPEGFPLPTLGVEPDGHITFEWYRSVTRTISVSIAPDGVLHYAALIGAAKHFGSEPFHGETPDVIAALIQTVTFG